MKHTPGPWKIKGFGWVMARNQAGTPVRVCTVATAQPLHSRHSNQAANARLIAAAPELYEAAVQALSLFPQLLSGSKLESAIRKAEGNTEST